MGLVVETLLRLCKYEFMESANSMKVFVSVVDEKSFSGAARSLNVPTSTVSRQIARIEDRLGVRLLHRTTRKLTPTDVGFAYYERCKRIVAEIQEAEAAVMDMQAVPQGLLRIAAPPTTARESFIERLVPEFMLRYPQVQCEVVVGNRFVDLISEGFDVAVRAGTLPDSSLIARRLFKACSGAVASPEYLERKGQTETAEDLADHDCLVHRSNEAPARWPVVDGASVAVSGSLIANDMNVIRASAELGLGIAHLPLGLLKSELEEGRLVPVLPGIIGRTVFLSLVYAPGRYLSAKVRAFVDFAAEYVKQNPAIAWNE